MRTSKCFNTWPEALNWLTTELSRDYNTSAGSKVDVTWEVFDGVSWVILTTKDRENE